MNDTDPHAAMLAIAREALEHNLAVMEASRARFDRLHMSVAALTDTITATSEALRSLTPAAAQVEAGADGVRVKALDWMQQSPHDETACAETILGSWTVWEIGDGYVRAPEDHAGRRVKGGLTAAKAAAQADYEARVLSCLTTPPAAALQVQAGEVERLTRKLDETVARAVSAEAQAIAFGGHYKDADARAEALERQLAKVTEALEPFAALAERYAPNSTISINDNVELWQVAGNKGFDLRALGLTVGDLRRAALADAETQEKDDA